MKAEFIGRKSRYRVKSFEPLTYGRLSVLLLAEDCESGFEVVLKLFGSSVVEQGLTDGFYQEIKFVSELRHRSILEIIDYNAGDEIEESCFLVFPYMRGGNLRSLMHGKAFYPTMLAIPFLRQVADAIDFSHASGVIHGDIKPENILLDEGHRMAFLSDFGIAKHFDIVDRVHVTAIRAGGFSSPGGIGGTSAYLSPEQLLSNRQTPKSDIYSFGLVAYELLVGQLPFDVNAPLYCQLHARVSGDLIAPEQANPAIPHRVANALRRVLNSTPEKRPNSAMDFVSMLELSKKWDIFIAHAGQDRNIAEALYDAIADRLNVFLDTKMLRLGDNWDSELARAQKEALVTVVLISNHTDEAYYAREEIACAIRMARDNPNTHRVVPIFLEEYLSRNPPYGLALKHGLIFNGSLPINLIADALDDLVQSIISNVVKVG